MLTLDRFFNTHCHLHYYARTTRNCFDIVRAPGAGLNDAASSPRKTKRPLSELPFVAGLKPFQLGSARRVLIPHKPRIGSCPAALSLHTAGVKCDAFAEHPDPRRRCLGEDCVGPISAFKKGQPQEQGEFAI